MNDLDALLTNLAFLEIRTAVLGIDMTLLDLRNALELSRQNKEELPGLSALFQALDLEAHVLRGWNREAHPALFAQQVYKRAVTLEYSDLIKLVEKRLAELTSPHLKLLWRISSGVTPTLPERVLAGHMDGVLAVAITPDDRYVVSGAQDGTVRKWDIQTGETVFESTDEKDFDGKMAITRDGNFALGFHNPTNCATSLEKY